MTNTLAGPADVMSAGSGPLLEAALSYAQRGWPVLPVVPRGKTPLTAHGLKDATTDLDAIAEWWTRTPTANVGIRTDEFVVVDCDGPDGKQNWLRFIDGVGFQSSPYAWTGGGGLHVRYRRDGHPVRNRAGWLEHVDIRSEGGYVIVPPSIHPSGADYWWNHGPDERAVPSMPSRLVDALQPKPVLETIGFQTRNNAVATRGGGDRYAVAALDREIDIVRHAANGARNQTLVTAAFNLGTLVGAGRLDADLVARELFAAATGVGLPGGEATATISSGLRAGIAQPRRR